MDKFKAKSSYSIKGEENIKKEIMERGTITVAFVVYSDFELYKVGIYQHVKGRRKLFKTAALETFYHLFVFEISSLQNLPLYVYFSLSHTVFLSLSCSPSLLICLSLSHSLHLFSPSLCLMLQESHLAAMQ